MTQKDLVTLADRLDEGTNDLSKVIRTSRVLEAVADGTAALLAYLDCGLRFVWANHAFLDRCGRTLEELTDIPYTDVFTQHAPRRAFEHARETGETVHTHGQSYALHPAPQQSASYWDCTVSPEFDDARCVCGFVVSLADVTESVSRAEKRSEELEEMYQREHNIAQVFQRTLLPEVNLSRDGYRIIADYHPALDEAEVGGDFYDVFDIGQGRLAFVMADVSGKGLKAAVYTAMTKNMVRAYVHEDPSPARVLEKLNSALCDYTPEELFITAFYGVLDTGRNTLTYADAGHDEPLMLCQCTKRVTPLDVTGIALGVVPGSRYSEFEVYMHPGDMLLLYTDGITDARSEGHFLGTNGITEVLQSTAHRGAEEVMRAIFQAATCVTGGKLRDDAAVLVVESE